MRKVLLTVTGLGLIGFGAVAAGPAFAGPTPEQSAAEWTEQTLPSTAATTTDSIADSGNPGNAVNGTAQRRIYLQQEQQQSLPQR